VRRVHLSTPPQGCAPASLSRPSIARVAESHALDVVILWLGTVERRIAVRAFPGRRVIAAQPEQMSCGRRWGQHASTHLRLRRYAVHRGHLAEPLQYRALLIGIAPLRIREGAHPLAVEPRPPGVVEVHVA
jgi:hypothetical protein